MCFFYSPFRVRIFTCHVPKSVAIMLKDEHRRGIFTHSVTNTMFTHWHCQPRVSFLFHNCNHLASVFAPSLHYSCSGSSISGYSGGSSIVYYARNNWKTRRGRYRKATTRGALSLIDRSPVTTFWTNRTAMCAQSCFISHQIATQEDEEVFMM